eukprot:TRINITY_DN8307_c0_g1_i1.p1 TRINITY_DN8307_c0_g1~~TRINITY_DN8307_c0_g1_i1.p1  ORF type:complete len:522 (+),score=142.21 TRINITY_DN8307_c0_g1_i1:372-1937(+)
MVKMLSISEAWQWLKENLLLAATFSGVVLGVLLGLALRPMELEKETIDLIAYPGELFMRLLKLMILPLVIASLITGAASLNAKMNGMIALRTMIYFITTSLLAALVGLVLVIIVHPGDPLTRADLGQGQQEEKKVSILDNFLDLGRNTLPDNLFQAAFLTAQTQYEEKTVNNTVESIKTLGTRTGTNTLGIIFFCLTFGTVLGSLGKKAAPVTEFFKVIDEVIMLMVNGIMWFSPVGIGSVICAKILAVNNLASVMSQLGLFIATVCSGIFLYQFVFLQAIYFVFVRKNPFRFWWNLFQSWMTAFATASTAAALPITFRCMEKNRVDPRISKFVLPIGATVNMDGTALFVTVASIFIAQMNSIPMNVGSYATVVLTSTAASIASASVPSAALVLMLIVLSAIDAPVQDVSLLWAVDWFVDRCRTTNNMLGDAYGAAVVEALSRRELELMDEAKYKTEEKEREEQMKLMAESADRKDSDEEALIGMIKSPSNISNGSRVEVQEVITVETSTDEEDNDEKTKL